MWKQLINVAIFAHISCGVWAASSPDSYPSRPIRVIDGYPAGGATDYLARIIGPKLTARLGQPVIVDNRPGAAGTTGAGITAHANPDGYTLSLAASTNLAASVSLYSRLEYDLLKDFAYISRVAVGTNVLLVNPSVPAKSIKELIALARAKPQPMTYGSGGVSSSTHLTMEMLRSRTGMNLLHVPYTGGAPLLVGIAAGEVEIGFSSLTGVVPLIQAKRVNALAVAGPKRNSLLPEVPTVSESGVPGFEVVSSFGILAPAKTPAAIVKLLNAEIRNAIQLDDIKAKLAEQALEPAGTTPEEFFSITKDEIAQQARIIKEAKIPLLD